MKERTYLKITVERPKFSEEDLFSMIMVNSGVSIFVLTTTCLALTSYALNNTEVAKSVNEVLPQYSHAFNNLVSPNTQGVLINMSFLGYAALTGTALKLALGHISINILADQKNKV